jgi:hypothetical protein
MSTGEDLTSAIDPYILNRDSNHKIVLTAENLDFLALNSYISVVPLVIFSGAIFSDAVFS